MLPPKKVLVIDEDQTALFLAQLTVKRIAREVQVQIASNGQEALKMVRSGCFQEQCPHLVFLDIPHQHPDRIDFLEELQNDQDLKHFSVQIVLVSSSWYNFQQILTKNYPVIDCIEKPLTPDKLSRFFDFTEFMAAK